jgi:peptidoglycan hydrolase CwlO-like protein
VLEQSLKAKDEIISELKNKIYSLDKENMELSQKLKNAENKVVTVKGEYQF